MNESIFALINSFQSIGTKLRDQISFTGLSDGPQSYNSGQYIKSSDNGIEYISLSGLGEELYTGKHFFRHFSELQDTPTGYQGHSGDYLVVNDGESGIHFTGIEKIAADLTDYGFGGGDSTIPSYTDLPDVTENDGKIVASGCDLYHSCNGEWIKIIKEDTITKLSEEESEGLPGCVATLEDKVNYVNYRDEVITQNASDTFSLSLQGLVSPTLHEACLYAEFQGLPDDSVNLKFVESNYKWAIAPDILLHPQIDYDAPAASQIFTVNNPGPYNSNNQESMLLLDEYGNYNSQIRDMHFSEDGLRAIGVAYQSLYIHEYLFANPYDLSTGSRSKFKELRASTVLGQSNSRYYSNLSGRQGILRTNDPSTVYVYYVYGVERKTLPNAEDLYSIDLHNDWYVNRVQSWSSPDYFGGYMTKMEELSGVNMRYLIASMCFANNGNTLLVLFTKHWLNTRANDQGAYLVSYNLETPYLLPGNMPGTSTQANQVVDGFLPAPSMEVGLDNITADNSSFPYQGSKIFGSGRYVCVKKGTKLVLLEMGVPGDLNTLFIKGEVQANPSAGIDDNILPHVTTSIFPKDNLDLFMFTPGGGTPLISTTLSDPRGSLEGSPCQFVEWKTSNQNLIINSTDPSNSEITFNQNLSITGVFNCN